MYSGITKAANDLVLKCLEKYHHKTCIYDENDNIKLNDGKVKYILRIDNGRPLDSDVEIGGSLEKAFQKFCKLNDLNPATSRFGWIQTLLCIQSIPSKRRF